jgi:ParB family chromosome partitioning protein
LVHHGIAHPETPEKGSAMSVATYGEETTILAAPDGLSLVEIPVGQLDLSPINKRKEYKINAGFRRSIQEKLKHPLIVYPAPPDAGAAYWVHDGNRRLLAARQDKRETLTCVIDPTLAEDLAEQYIGQVTTAEQREGLTPQEKADALFEAVQAGASKTVIGRRTGYRRETVNAALKAGALSAQARQTAEVCQYDLTFDELALLAELDGDSEAMDQVNDMIARGRQVKYAVEYVRGEREEAAAHAALLAELAKAGVPVTDDLPDGAVQISTLAYSVEGFNREAHEKCAGHGAFFPSYSKLEPVCYCTTPDAHGYRPPQQGTIGNGSTSKPVDPEARKIVIAGNKAWKAAAVVRLEWLAQRLLARATAPGHTLAFVTRMLMTMPEPLGDRLREATRSPLYATLAGTLSVDAIPTARPGKLQLLALLPIAVAFEHQMTQAGESKSTWRDNKEKWSPCKPADAAAWLDYLIKAGYEPCPIELAVAHGLPYVGDDVDYAASTAETVSAHNDDNEQHASQSTDPSNDTAGQEHPLEALSVPAPGDDQALSYDPDAFVDPQADGAARSAPLHAPGLESPEVTDDAPWQVSP